MAAEHPDAYWRAVALGIEAENQKAMVYVTHYASLGVAREAIIRKVLENETPGPFLIKTGLIREPTLIPIPALEFPINATFWFMIRTMIRRYTAWMTSWW